MPTITLTFVQAYANILVMKPQDSISSKYDIPTILGDAVREVEAIKTVSSLEDLFNHGNSEPVSISNDLGSIFHEAHHLTSDMLFNNTSRQMSKPYDSFTQDGVNLVSRVIRLGSEVADNHPLFTSSNIYLVSLMGDEQKSVSARNCPFGALSTKNGNIEFFKIEKNANIGKIIVNEVMKDGESDRILAEKGSIDWHKIKLTALSPEERYQVTLEFEKALDTLKS